MDEDFAGEMGMTVSTEKLTFAEYLAYDDGTDTR
jgi:hypothetical protein